MAGKKLRLKRRSITYESLPEAKRETPWVKRARERAAWEISEEEIKVVHGDLKFGRRLVERAEQLRR